MRDTYVRIIHFKGCPPAAEFKWDYPCIIDRGIKTHFLLNLDSLRTRVRNLKLPKNGAPHDLTQEFRALIHLIPAHIMYVQ